MLILKYIHIFTVVFSLLMFVWRWRLLAKNLPRPVFLRWLPHLNDTILLTTGIAMAWLWQWNPLQQFWLLGKIVLLVIYILLGARALHHLQRNGHEGRWGLSALVVYIVIMTLAIMKPGMI